MMHKISRETRCEFLLCLLLAASALFFCWLNVGRFGLFASNVDWISQHSVIPDYFRKRFYETGELFPEFALNLGGGQNIFHFSYYGLYNPLLLPSYLLPFVKMGDYLMTVSVLNVMVTPVLFFCWLGKRGFSLPLRFFTSLLLLLSGPVIYHSAKHVMFVNYLPFLCMAFRGIDRYFEKKRTGLYLLSVFLMILTSFYYSVGALLVLVIYGLHRYLEMKGDAPLRLKSFLCDGIRFLLPMVTAVLMSSFLLLPTAAALAGNRSSKSTVLLSQILFPRLSLSRHLYGAYGIGLSSFLPTVLAAQAVKKKRSSSVPAICCLAVLIFPVFMWLLNGKLYIREKALIPFLPLCCYLIACYCREQKASPPAFLPYLVTILLLFMENGQKQTKTLLLLDACVMLLWFGLWYLFLKRRPALSWMLLVPPVLFLALCGGSFHTNANLLQPESYNSLTDRKIGETIQEILNEDPGLYRTEQLGSNAQRAANTNRIWDAGQLISSLYSSSFNHSYQEFRTSTLDTEMPSRNFMSQRASENPVFRKLMGIKYLVDPWGTAAAPPTGYELYKQNGNIKIYRSDAAAPLFYATDRLISEGLYKTLAFPGNQTVFEHYAVIDSEEEKTLCFDAQAKELACEGELQDITAAFDALIRESRTDKAVSSTLTLPEHKQATLFVQFHVRNLKPKEDLNIEIGGIKNTLSSDSPGNFYYNGNRQFTYAVPLSENQNQIPVTFGKGKYEISNVRCFLAQQNDSTELYQSEFLPDKEGTKGNRITGTINVKQNGCFITSIPFDTAFEVRVDGKTVPSEKVNTAFLGFPISSGKHQIEITYHAPGAAAGRLISLLTFTAWIACSLPTAKRRRASVQAVS